MHGIHARQAPPPPPHTPLPEDFQNVNANAETRAAEDLLKAQKKQMKDELDAQLRQLDGERKEGLYRLDWELAEAVEALHARHADRANKMITQHRQTISQMEERVQAGEHMTPEKIQGLRSPMQARPPAQAPLVHPHGLAARSDSMVSYEEVSEESEEEESEEEGVFSRINNFLGQIRDDVLQPQDTVHRRPQQMMYPQHDMNGHAPPMNGYALPVNGHGPPNGHGALGSPQMSNGLGSPSAHPHGMTPELHLANGQGMLPELPFANGQGNFDVPSPFSNGMPSALEPTLAPLNTEWSLSAVGLSPELGFACGLHGSPLKNSLGPSPGSSPLGSMRPNWPPANVYHGGR